MNQVVGNLRHPNLGLSGDVVQMPLKLPEVREGANI